MSSANTGLTCPHCSGAISRDATTCPGCGAVKKMVGGGPSKKSIMVTDLLASLVGAAAGLAVRYYVFPFNAGVGDYVSAAVLGAGALGYIVFQSRGGPTAVEAKPMAVWEKPKA